MRTRTATRRRTAGRRLSRAGLGAPTDEYEDGPRCNYNYNPTTAEIRAALLDPFTESAYFVDNDILISGDENCVGFDVRTRDRWQIHNHPIDSSPNPSAGDFCAANAVGAERTDIIWGPMVRTMTTVGEGGSDFPCDRSRHPHGPPPSMRGVRVEDSLISSYPLLRKGVAAARESWFDSPEYRAGKRSDAGADDAPVPPRQSLLEIDGALGRALGGDDGGPEERWRRKARETVQREKRALAEFAPAVAAEPAKRVRRLYELDCRQRRTDVQMPGGWQMPVRTPPQLAEVFRAYAEDADKESLMAIHLDGRHRPIAFQEVARGSGNVVHVTPRDVFRPAVASAGAVAIVIAHNHPSGDAMPSPDDLDLTRRMNAAGDLVGMPVIDHLVISNDSYYSFLAGRLFRFAAPSAKSDAAARGLVGLGIGLLALVGGYAVLRATQVLV